MESNHIFNNKNKSNINCIYVYYLRERKHEIHAGIVFIS